MEGLATKMKTMLKGALPYASQERQILPFVGCPAKNEDLIH